MNETQIRQMFASVLPECEAKGISLYARSAIQKERCECGEALLRPGRKP